MLCVTPFRFVKINTNFDRVVAALVIKYVCM